MSSPADEGDCELWRGGCGGCTAHMVTQPHLIGAFASVGIELGKSTWEMAEDYFAAFHKNKHREP